jgi:hypothetical protein
MKWSWEYIAKVVERDYGCYVDWDEEFYICPECDEPIYKCDYPFIKVGMICPVCENETEE